MLSITINHRHIKVESEIEDLWLRHCDKINQNKATSKWKLEQTIAISENDY